jgi:hypothetical protein
MKFNNYEINYFQNNKIKSYECQCHFAFSSFSFFFSACSEWCYKLCIISKVLESSQIKTNWPKKTTNTQNRNQSLPAWTYTINTRYAPIKYQNELMVLFTFPPLLPFLPNEFLLIPWWS